MLAFSNIRQISKVESETRRALSAFTKISRHYRTSLIQDTQQLGDVYGSVITLQDGLYVKKTMERMLPDNFKWIIKRIKEKRFKLMNYFNNNRFIRQNIAVFYKDLEWLAPNEYYIITDNDEPILRWNPLPPFHHKKVNDHWADLAGIEIIREEPKREEKLGNSDTKLTKERSKEEKFVITVGIVEELRQKGDSRPPWGLFMRNIVQLSTKISEMTYICRHKDHYELYILE